MPAGRPGDICKFDESCVNRNDNGNFIANFPRDMKTLLTFFNELLAVIVEQSEELAALREKTRWIPVEERLPEIGQTVFIRWKNMEESENPEMATVFEDGFNCFYLDESGCEKYYLCERVKGRGNITHWRYIPPLPDPPESEE
jgi:hypothetical protein